MIEKIGLLGTQERRAALFALGVTMLYMYVCYVYLFALTAPSDPLQYVAPALSPEQGFAFLDRVALWLWIRFFALFPLPPEAIGGIATLCSGAVTLALGAWWLTVKRGALAGGVFAFLYVVTPTVLGIASYTYPMQLMTMVLVATLVAMDRARSAELGMFLGGFGFTIAIFSKVQAFPFLVVLAVYAWFYRGERSGWHHPLRVVAGMFSALAVLAVMLILLDGWESIPRLFGEYFGATADAQFQGRASGGMPPFYMFLLEPASVFALAGGVLVWLKKEFAPFRLFSLAAMAQLGGLIAIYAITQRGGPLITNYLLDAHVLGLIAFSGTLATLWPSQEERRHLFWVASLVVAIALFAVAWNALYAANAYQYSPVGIGRDSNDVLFGMVAWVAIGLLWLYTADVAKSILLPILGTSLVLLSALTRSDEGVHDAMFRKHYWDGQYALCRYIQGMESGETVWVSVRLNRANAADGSRRCERIYEAFFARGPGPRVVFDEREPVEYGMVLTDRPELIDRFGVRAGNRAPASNPILGMHAYRASELGTLPESDVRVNVTEGDALIFEVIEQRTKMPYLVVKPVGGSAEDLRMNLQLWMFPQKNDGEERVFTFAFGAVGLGNAGEEVLFTTSYSLDGRPYAVMSKVDPRREHTMVEHRVPAEAEDVSSGWVINAPSFRGTVYLPQVMMSRERFKTVVGNVHEFDVKRKSVQDTE